MWGVKRQGHKIKHTVFLLNQVFLLYQLFFCEFLDILQPYIKSFKETTWAGEITLWLTINSRAESSQESPHSGVALTYSHGQVEGGDVVFLWSHWHGWLKDGAQRQQEGDSFIVVKCDVLFGKISRSEGGEGLT